MDFRRKTYQLMLSINLLLIRFAARFELAKRLYAAVLKRFSREQQAVLSGIVAHHNISNSTRGHNNALRRAIHRIEKGLLMRPLASIFAVEYIEAAVSSYVAALNSKNHEKTELAWAESVLTKYFDHVGTAKSVSHAKLQFKESQKANVSTANVNGPLGPYEHALISRSTVEFKDLKLLFAQRRSVRWFQAKSVNLSIVQMAVEAALQAPSACNRQPFYFKFVESKHDVQRIAEIAMGTTGYSHQIPLLCILIGDWSAFEDERDRHLPYIDGSLAAMQLMLALETLGLSSCPINWPDVEALERKMAKELQLPDFMRPIMLMAIGYADPAGKVASSVKKPVTSMIIREKSELDR